MDNDILNLNNKTYSNNNNILIEIINDINQLMNSIHDNIIIKRLGDIINKINYIVNENKKNFELIRNDISLLEKKMNKRFDELKINNTNNKINNQELKFKDGRYIGEVVNGLAEGKGIFYGFSGNRYEGEWRNDKKEGKGIFYWNADPWKGDRYEGDFRNDKYEGKGIYYYHDGRRNN